MMITGEKIEKVEENVSSKHSDNANAIPPIRK
jgi:hypothetical protein